MVKLAHKGKLELMHPYLPTMIVRHQRENLKKCSLRGLEEREDMQFYTYPKCVKTLSSESFESLASSYVCLTLDAPELSIEDASNGLFLIDATWRLAGKIHTQLKGIEGLKKRSLPASCLTAYPRRQDDCLDPTRGLASAEALFLAYFLLGRSTEGILANYHWKDAFLKQNAHILTR
ncbi:MAG: hypothetical protein K0S07_1231 [Chlamydiales bacterium]|jgi:pre-rRNA-processing protein TSR3|nr:hypothetical protein [Chlamydiales bacterium]